MNPLLRPAIFRLAAVCCLILSTSSWGQGCEPTPTSLCMNEGRFQVQVTWQDFANNSSTVPDFATGGMAGATPFDTFRDDDNWGGFWFFNPDNLDILVHIFNGCSINDRFWVFSAGLSNVEVGLTVTDTVTGETQTYDNDLQQSFEPIQDTEAFNTCPGAKASSDDSTGKADFEIPDWTSIPEDLADYLRSASSNSQKGSCVSDEFSACLQDGRFAVEVLANDANVPVLALADGTVGVNLDNPTFFDEFIYIIDARSVDGFYRTGYSAFNGGDYRINITDTVTGGGSVFVRVPENTDNLSSTFSMAFAAGDGAQLPGEIDGTFSGSWFALDRNGEGFIFDIVVLNGIPTLVAYYFTFENNDSGRQAWLVGSAPIIGNYAAVPVVITDGTQFGPGFDAEDVIRTPWGHITFTFDSCELVRIESTSTLFPNLNYTAQRLVGPPVGVFGTCQPAPTKTMQASLSGKGVSVDGGYSGSWLSLERSGEGFIFNIAEVDGVPTIVVFYFTYENNDSGRQAWLVGSAPLNGNSATVPMVIAAGTQFGAPFNPDDVVRTDWGNVTVQFTSCSSASVMVESPLFGDIDFDIEPLTPPPIGTTGDCAVAAN